MKTGIIYKATNKINGKIYIGQTFQNLKRRINRHISSAKKGNNPLKFISGASSKQTMNTIGWTATYSDPVFA